MQSFSQFTTQLDETMSGLSVVTRKPRRSQLLRSIATNIKDRLTGGQKKRGDIDKKQVVKIRRGAMLGSLNPTRKQRLDQATKTLKGLRDSGKFGDPGLEGNQQRKIANARIKALASGLGKRKDQINKAAEAIAARRGISVRDARKRVVRQAISRAVNRMETRAARSRLNENLQQLDEFIMNIVGSGVQALGDIAAAYMQNRMQKAMQKKTQRMEKRRALQQAQSQQDVSQGIVPTQTNVSNLQINTNPRSTVAQLRGSAGAEFGRSSVGKQFAAMY